MTGDRRDDQPPDGREPTQDKSPEEQIDEHLARAAAASERFWKARADYFQAQAELERLRRA